MFWTPCSLRNRPDTTIEIAGVGKALCCRFSHVLHYEWILFVFSIREDRVRARTTYFCLWITFASILCRSTDLELITQPIIIIIFRTKQIFARCCSYFFLFRCFWFIFCCINNSNDCSAFHMRVRVCISFYLYRFGTWSIAYARIAHSWSEHCQASANGMVKCTQRTMRRNERMRLLHSRCCRLRKPPWMMEWKLNFSAWNKHRLPGESGPMLASQCKWICWQCAASWVLWDLVMQNVDTWFSHGLSKNKIVQKPNIAAAHTMC